MAAALPHSTDIGTQTQADQVAAIGALAGVTSPGVLSETGGSGSLLDLEKNKCTEVETWRPGEALPAWWGTEEGSCGKTVVMKLDGDTATYVPVLCKRWSCAVCSYYRYCWLVRNIVENMERHDCTRFWTLTLRTSRSASESFIAIKGYWRRLVNQLRRKYGAFEFMWVVESTKQGTAHLHVLVNKYFPQKVVSALWLAITGDSSVVYAEKLTGTDAARYVAKYVGKEARERKNAGGQLMGMHVFGKSQGIEFDAFMPKGGTGWVAVQGSWQTNAAWLERNCVVLEKRMTPTPRYVVAHVRGTNTHMLRAWLDHPLPQREGPPSRASSSSRVMSNGQWERFRPEQSCASMSAEMCRQ